MKHLSIFALPFILAACASNPPLPMPKGKAVPVNSLATAERLAHQTGFVVVGEQRHMPEVRERLLRRPVNAADYATVPGGELIERIVIVPFPYGSTKFQPTPAQAFRLNQLLAAADRAEVRGRTDAVHNTAVNRVMAQRRAEAARHYLIDHGMPSEFIAVNYMASGDPVASNQNTVGRAANRRVELEFYIDDFATAKPNNCVTAQRSTTGCGSKRWESIKSSDTQAVQPSGWQAITATK